MDQPRHGITRLLLGKSTNATTKVCTVIYPTNHYGKQDDGAPDQASFKGLHNYLTNSQTHRTEGESRSTNPYTQEKREENSK